MPGPYIGPRGGEWADPAHTIPWDPVEVRPHPRLGMDAAPRRYHRVPTTDGRVRLVPERYAEEGLAGGPAMHQDSVEHFKADLEGRVVAPLTGRADVDAVLEGRAELLGKGDDGIAFRAGDKVVKVSTTVPYQPENGGHRSPQEAADMLAAQVAAGNALADLGLAVQRSELIRSGRKAFQVKAFVEIPERWTLDQLGTIRATLEGMHDAGWSLNDEVQAGIEPGGRIVLFDVGKASRSTGSGRDGSAARDLERLADLYHASGYSLREAAMTPRERVASAQIEDWRATPDAALLRDLTGARSVLVSARRVLEEEAAKRLAGDRLAARLDEIDLDLTFDVFRLEDLEATVNDAAGEVKKALAAARPVRPARSHVGLVAMALLAARVAEEEELFKGGAHRYIRKVPTGRVTKTGKPIHRYFYAVTGGAGLHRVQEEIRVGASFQGVVEDKKGHYHVVAAVAGERSTGGPDDRFNVVHDESGVHFQLTRAELADRLRVEHADPLAAVQERIRSNLAAAMGTGTERQIRRLRDLAEKYGVEPEELDTSIFKHHQTAENNPPSWQGLDLSVLPWVSTTRTWVDRYTGRQRSAPGWELNRRAGDERSQFLEDTGFFDVLFDPQKPNDQFRASLLRTLNEKPWEQLTDKQKEWGYKIIRDLTAWWTDLRDDDREKFWAEFLDQSKQTPLQARVADPAQENAELPPIAGLRKFHDRGFNLHEYQRKMVNWLADAAPRALIAAEMGLGKTICAVAAFEKLAERGEVSQMLVTAPLAAMGSWESHLAYTDRKVAILGGATAKQRKAAYDALSGGRSTSWWSPRTQWRRSPRR
jgi:hypothetical protein